MPPPPLAKTCSVATNEPFAETASVAHSAGAGQRMPVRRGRDAEGVALVDRLVEQIDERVADARIPDPGGGEKELHAYAEAGAGTRSVCGSATTRRRSIGSTVTTRTMIPKPSHCDQTSPIPKA